MDGHRPLGARVAVEVENASNCNVGYYVGYMVTFNAMDAISGQQLLTVAHSRVIVISFRTNDCYRPKSLLSDK